MHNPPLLSLCIKIPYLPSPLSFLPTPFLAKRSLFLPVTLRTYCTGEPAPSGPGPPLVSLVLCSLLGALFLGGLWVIEQPWAFGDL